MAPTTSVRSIRLPNAVWAQLAGRAEREGISVNALVARLVSAVPAKRAPAAEKQIAETWGHPSVPFAGDLERKPYQRGKK